MSLGEFKAWLAGYLESCSASPLKRVKRIEEKLAEVREVPVSVPYPVYPDRYVDPNPWIRPQFTWTTTDGRDWANVTWMVSNDTIATCDGNSTVAYLNVGGVE